MPTVVEVFEETRAEFGTVPRADKPYVCPLCLGPRNPGFSHCIGCSNLLRSNAVPADLLSKVVPMTTTLNPSAWYRRLVTYKTFRSEYSPTLAALAYTYLRANRRRLESLLGGAWDTLSVVPSKRGVSFDRQPLARSLALVEAMKERLVDSLEFREGAAYRRQVYDPSWFAAGPTPVAGDRVLLIEDTWASGATALSAAGKLLDLGAGAVVLLPLARCIDESFWHDQAPEYLREMRAPYDPGAWPR